MLLTSLSAERKKLKKTIKLNCTVEFSLFNLNSFVWFDYSDKSCKFCRSCKSCCVCRSAIAALIMLSYYYTVNWDMSSDSSKKSEILLSYHQFS